MNGILEVFIRKSPVKDFSNRGIIIGGAGGIRTHVAGA